MTARAGTVGGIYVQKPWSVRHDSDTKYGTVTDPSNGVLDFTANKGFTVEVWAKLSDDACGHLVRKSTVDYSLGWRLYTVSDGNTLVFATGEGGNDGEATSTSDVCNDRWMHLVGVRSEGAASGGTNKTYVNGVLDGTDSDSTIGQSIANSSDLLIGDGDLYPTYTRPRDIGLVRIWDRALTAVQISDLHFGGMPEGDFRTNNVVGEWLLTDGTGVVGYDSSGQDNNAAFSGTPSWISDVYDTETAENIGTGNGTLTAFNTAYANVDNNNLTVTVDGVAKTLGEDFSLSPKGTVTFFTAPASGAVVATYRHYPMVLECGGFTNWSIDWTAEALDCTDFISGGNREFAAGVKSWSASADRHWVNRWMDTLVGNQIIVKFFHDEPNDMYFDGWAIVTGLSPSVANEGLVDESLTFQGTSFLAAESGR